MEKDIDKHIKIFEEAVYRFPQIIKDNPRLSELANLYLPYSTGFEIECNQLDCYDINDFKSIPNIMDVNPSSGEQRFRIPKGIDGLICLYDICDKLLVNCSLNMESGIHYHIDMTDSFDVMDDQFIKDTNDWVIEELVKWGTAKRRDSYAVCSRHRAWVRYAEEHKTLEIRIGEMTFDYEVICKRIIDSNRIVARLKSQVGQSIRERYLKQAESKAIQLREELKEEVIDIHSIIKRRVINARS